MPPGSKENRKSRRREVGYRAWLRYGDDPVLVPCTMRDASETGAQLVLPENADIPDEFILQLTEAGTASRKCRVAWRKKNKVGVAFIVD